MTTSQQTPYTLRQLEQLLGLRRTAIRALMSACFMAPPRGSGNSYRFTFQDIVVLRTAAQLVKGRVPASRMLRSLRSLRDSLPAGVPLSGLRLKAIGGAVAVRRADARWENAMTQQLLLDFEAASPISPNVAQPPSGLMSTASARAPTPCNAQQWFEHGASLEDADCEAAEVAYRSALRADPEHVKSLLNLGALLCHLGRCAEAVELYDRAIESRPGDPALHFNHAIALEDQQRFAAAVASYGHVLALEPDCADAHFNAARLYDRLGNRQRALRHYSAYRRLQR